MRILIWSESTRVPPVTAERSPPASRMTGADSPVIADSSTEATPSMISPSPGINSPAARSDHTSSERNSELGTTSIVAIGLETVRRGLGASLAQCLRLGLAAALGHGFREVRKYHREPQPERDLQSPDEAAMVRRANRGRAESLSINAPTSTTNMTGFLIISRGSSFWNEPAMAVRRIFGSVREMDL